VGPEVRAAVPAPCPTEQHYPIGGARHVELAWGIGARGPSDVDVTFRAVVRVADRPDLEVVNEKVTASAGDLPTWFSRVVELPEEVRRGTLVLTARGSSRASFWAAPVFSRASSDSSTRNVILVSLDTVRADHLNAYGYKRRWTSPEIADWARKGTLFETAMSTAPGTLSSQMSVLTGRYPSRHGVSYTNWRLRGRMPVLRPDIRTLAEIIAPRGILTAAYTGAGYFALPLGYSRGFGEFVSTTDESMGSAAHVFGKGFAWLERHRDDRFFLFLHTYEAHLPYLDRRFVEREGSKLQSPGEVNEARYDGDIRRADKYVGKLRRLLDKLDLTSRTLVVVYSDHGEEFGDHFPVWADGHGHALYDEEIHVPLLMAGPGIPPGRRVKQVVDLTAVAPTVLEYLGVTAPDGIDGRSLLGILATPPDAEDEGLAFSEDVWIGPATRAVRTRDWKLIEKAEVLPERFVDVPLRRVISRQIKTMPRRRLFHLPTDPKEQENEVASHEALAARLGDLLHARGAGASHVKPATEMKVEGEVRDRLRALGYVQ
jgi:arylsulfatase A-like enzyme